MSDSDQEEDEETQRRGCCEGCGFADVVHISSIATTILMAILVGTASASSVSSVLKWTGIVFLLGNVVVIGISMLSCATVVPLETGVLAIVMALCTVGGGICLGKWVTDSASVLLCTGITLFGICGTSSETFVGDFVKLLVGITIALQAFDIALLVYAASCGKVGRAFGVARKARKLGKRSKRRRRRGARDEEEDDNEDELGTSGRLGAFGRSGRFGYREEVGGEEGTVARGESGASESEEEQPFVARESGRRQSLVSQY